MTTTGFESIDYQRYQQIVRRQLPNLEYWGVFDGDATLVYCSRDSCHADCVMRQSSAGPCPADTGSERGDGSRLVRYPLHANTGACCGELVFLLAAQDERQRAAIDLIGAGLNRELQLQQELNSMALELSERYEELNLVYESTDDDDAYAVGQEALSQLVHNCIAYLDVDYAQLWLPRQKINLVHRADDKGSADRVHLSNQARDGLWEQMQARPRPIVANAVGELQANQLDNFPPYKLLAVPVISQSRRPIGFFMLAKLPTKPDFSNSDRNLTEVMSRKAVKVLNNNFDGLTGLTKRNGLEHYLRLALESCRYKGLHHCLILLDLDKFSIVNETLGYDNGDRVLLRVTELLQDASRDSDTLARLSADTFGLLLEGCPLAQGQQLAEQLVREIHQLEAGPAQDRLTLSASAGLYCLDGECGSVELLMSRAEISLKLAKENGGSRVQPWSSDDQELAIHTSEIHWVSRIQTALREDRFIPYVQPIVPLHASAEQCYHGEILLRFQDESGIVPPARFLPAAEHYHLMPAIDQWVIEHSLAKIKAARSGIWSINLSGQFLAKPEFLPRVRHLIDASGIDPRHLCFEITETSAIGELRKARKVIDQLRNLGCRFSLDDFGTGLSSFSYLQQLPVDYLKIDGSFVRRIVDDPVACTMVSATHQVAKAMGLQTIAEYVENEAIRDRLVEIGIDFAQGYLYGKPEPLLEATP